MAMGASLRLTKSTSDWQKQIKVTMWPGQSADFNLNEVLVLKQAFYATEHFKPNF